MRSIGEELFKLAALATLFVGYGLEGDREKPVDLFFVVGLLLWMVIAAAVVKLGGSRPGTLMGEGWAWACVAMLVVTLAWFPFSLRHYYACPHGQRWASNQIGIARSSTGGPCGNGPRARGDHRWQVNGPWYVFIPTRY